MVFGTDPHIALATAHLKSGDDERLKYACLELRFALERIAYQKLQLRLDKITLEEVGAWQPKRIIESLMELVDASLDQGFEIRVASNGDDGQPLEKDFKSLGFTKGINPKNIGKHWQKLGSFLHVAMPKRKGQKPKSPDQQVLIHYLQEVISYIEAVTSTKFDAHFSNNVTFQCSSCEQNIVRNSDLLAENDVVQCQNPNCDEAFLAHIDGEEFYVTRYEIPFECPSCKWPRIFGANEILRLGRGETREISCQQCGSSYTLFWGPQVQAVADKKELRDNRALDRPSG